MATESFETQIEAGTKVTIINRPLDARTIYVDSVFSVAMDKAVAKVGFVETMPSGDGTIEGKVVLNLVISRESLKSLAESLTDAVRNVENMETVRQNG